MKKKLIVIFAALVAAVGLVSAKSPNIIGTWKMISRNGKAAAPENYTFIKHFTPTHYIWTLTDPQGNIIDGAGGTYSLKCNTLTTAINQALPRMKQFYNSKNASEITIKGKRMTQIGLMRDIGVVEIWEKIE